MANLNRSIIRYSCLVIGLAAFGSVFAIRGNPCVERESAEVTSPNKKYVVKIGRSTCGASPQDKTFVSLERRTFLPNWLAGFESKVWLHGPRDIVPQWLADGRLVLKCWSCDNATASQLSQLRVGGARAHLEPWGATAR